MLVDGFKGLYNVAVVVSDDSDLLDPVRLVRSELGLKVGAVLVSADRDFARFPGLRQRKPLGIEQPAQAGVRA